jgi:hypothetical protein
MKKSRPLKIIFYVESLNWRDNNLGILAKLGQGVCKAFKKSSLVSALKKDKRTMEVTWIYQINMYSS